MNMYIWFKVPPLLVIPSPAENRPRGTPGLADYEQRGGTEGRLDTAEGRCGWNMVGLAFEWVVYRGFNGFQWISMDFNGFVNTRSTFVR